MPGWRQRAATAAAAARSSVEAPSAHDGALDDAGKGSFLCALLVYLWAWGFMSPQTIQKLTAAAAADMRRMDGPDRVQILHDLDSLAGLGSNGTYHQNMHRELVTYLGDAEVKVTKLPFPMREQGSSVLMRVAQCGILLPHTLFALLGNTFPKAFQQLMCPSRERLSEFWANMNGNPQLEGY